MAPQRVQELDLAGSGHYVVQEEEKWEERENLTPSTCEHKQVDK